MRATAIPPALLTVVALCQIALVRAEALTPWKGGGFGMFSTLDHGAYRGVDVVIEAPDRSEQQDVPPSLDTLAARAATCPSDWLLRRLAEGVVARERRYERPVTTVRLTVWQTRFDPRTLLASERTLRVFTYTVP